MKTRSNIKLVLWLKSQTVFPWQSRKTCLNHNFTQKWQIHTYFWHEKAVFFTQTFCLAVKSLYQQILLKSYCLFLASQREYVFRRTCFLWEIGCFRPFAKLKMPRYGGNRGNYYSAPKSNAVQPRYTASKCTTSTSVSAKGVSNCFVCVNQSFFYCAYVLQVETRYVETTRTRIVDVQVEYREIRKYK